MLLIVILYRMCGSLVISVLIVVVFVYRNVMLNYMWLNGLSICSVNVGIVFGVLSRCVRLLGFIGMFVIWWWIVVLYRNM